MAGKPVSPTDPNLVKQPGYAQVRRLMKAVNELYHLAYTAAARASQDEGLILPHPLVETTNLGVMTSTTLAFPELLDRAAGAGPFAGADDGAEDWAAGLDPDALARIDSLLLTPGTIKFKQSFEFVSRLVTKGSVRRARQDYFRALEAFLRGDETYAQAHGAMETFAEELALIMKDFVQRTAYEYVLTTVVNMATSAAGLSLLRGTVASIVTDKAMGWTIERLTRRRIEMGLRDDAIVAHQSLPPATLLRQMMRYSGPLNPGATTGLLDTVSPFPA